MKQKVMEDPDVWAAPSVFGKKLAKFYSPVIHGEGNENTIYVKMDDDVVFIGKN